MTEYFYSQIEGWFDYEDYYENVIQAVPENGIIVEVGVWKGRSICFLGERAKELGKKLQIYGVDPFVNEEEIGDELLPPEDRLRFSRSARYLETIINLEKAGIANLVTIIPQFSEDACQMFPDKSIDLVYLDGHHGYNYVKQDLEIWWEKVKINGILSGHDYKSSETIRKLVKEFTENKRKKFKIHGESRQVFAIGR